MPAIRTEAVFTYRDYLTLPDDGKRYEVLEGELVVTPAPFWSHQHVVAELISALNRYFKRTRGGIALPAPLDVIFDDLNVCEPDLVVLLGAHARPTADGPVRIVPDVVIEVLSPGTRARDLGAKRALYARFGVPEYWVFDPARRRALVYRFGERLDAPVRTIEGARMLTSPLLPRFRLRLDSVWPEPGPRSEPEA